MALVPRQRGHAAGKDREFTHAVKELRDEPIVQAIDAWETSEFDQADALCERLEYALNNEP